MKLQLETATNVINLKIKKKGIYAGVNNSIRN